MTRCGNRRRGDRLNRLVSFEGLKLAAAAVLSQLVVVYVPSLQWVFRTELINGAEWLQIFLLALTVVVVEFDKWLRRKGALHV